MPFKPGQSGNPGGRKRGRARQLAEATYVLCEFIVKGEKTIIELKSCDGEKDFEFCLYAVMLRDALAGDKKAMEMFLDRSGGKPAQMPQPDEGGEAEPLRVEVSIVDASVPSPGVIESTPN